MKTLKILLISALVLGLNGCYTKIAKDDPYADEYKIIKDENQYADNDVEYDTVYVDENGNPIEEENDGDVYYINNNYYYDDFDIYRHYFTGYAPCFYCEPFPYVSIAFIGGWYYYTPPAYVAYYYPYYPPYYYGGYYVSPYKVRTHHYYAGLRNHYGRHGYGLRRGGIKRRSGAIATAQGRQRSGTVRRNPNRNGNGVNLDELIVGNNSGGKKKGANGTKTTSINRKIANDEIASVSGKNKKRGENTPPVKQKRIGSKKNEITSGKNKSKKNYQISPPVHKNGDKRRISKEPQGKKRKVIIYKKKTTPTVKRNAGYSRSSKTYSRSGSSPNRSSKDYGYKPKNRRPSSSHGTTSRIRSGSSGKTNSRSYSSPSHRRSHSVSTPRSSGSSRRSSGSSRSRGSSSRRSR